MNFVKGFGIGVGIFVSYIVFTFAFKGGDALDGENVSGSNMSLEKVKMAHMIGVYEGSYPDGKQRGFRQPQEGKVYVIVKNNPEAESVTLLLTSYESVDWHLEVAEGVTIDEVILSSYHPSKVTGLKDVPVLRKSWGYSYERAGSIGEKFANEVGVEIESFQGSYKGNIFDIF